MSQLLYICYDPFSRDLFFVVLFVYYLYVCTGILDVAMSPNIDAVYICFLSLNFTYYSERCLRARLRSQGS